jgi:hypothetical protein
MMSDPEDPMMSDHSDHSKSSRQRSTSLERKLELENFAEIFFPKKSREIFLEVDFENHGNLSP